MSKHIACVLDAVVIGMVWTRVERVDAMAVNERNNGCRTAVYLIASLSGQSGPIDVGV